jgi:hypothetical protein
LTSFQSFLIAKNARTPRTVKKMNIPIEKMMIGMNNAKIGIIVKTYNFNTRRRIVVTMVRRKNVKIIPWTHLESNEQPWK